MTQDATEEAAIQQPRYSDRSADYYLNKLDPETRLGFTLPQLDAVRQLLDESIPKPAPKLVDLRFTLHLLAYRFFIVLFIGKDRRRRDRQEVIDESVHKGNVALLVLCLIGINMLISLFVLVIAFSIKYAIGLSLFPG